MRALLAAAFAAACAPTAAAPPPGEWRPFAGTWTAAGDRHTIETRPGTRASFVELSGPILLAGERGLGVGFQGRVIAWSDGETSAAGRAVWTDERGDLIYSELSGAEIAEGRHITGRFTGGTGRWSGIGGEYGFDWKYVIDADGRIHGRAESLRGRARIVRPEGRTP